jgi:hypothetical protein
MDYYFKDRTDLIQIVASNDANSKQTSEESNATN